MTARRPDPAGGQSGPSPALRKQLRGIRTGITLIALMGGLALYIFLSQHGMSGLLAGALGFVFALLGRFAMAALIRDWLLHISARRSSGAAREPESEPPAANRAKR